MNHGLKTILYPVKDLTQAKTRERHRAASVTSIVMVCAPATTSIGKQGAAPG